MNVLVVHNRYREAGGEDRVVELESALLRRHGHTVVPYVLENASIDGMNPLTLAARTIWNPASRAEVTRLIASERIHLVHVHNTLPLASPSVYSAAVAAGVPVVQTLHNYRLLCPSAVLVRDGRPCVTCIGSSPLPAVRHACYRGSRPASAAVAAMLMVHRAAGTYRRQVHTYVVPAEFARGMFVAGGLPADRLVVKPHFVDPDPGVGAGRGGYALYVGRLSKEKGVETLLAAWGSLGGRIPLRIVGDGPLSGEVARAARQVPGVTWLGRRGRAEIDALMGDAALLIFPSIFHETFGQVVIEAYATGTPVVATSGGTAAELIVAGRTGALVRAGDADGLASSVAGLFANPERLAEMRTAARRLFESRYTAEANYPRLMDIYRNARSPAAVIGTAAPDTVDPAADSAAIAGATAAHRSMP